MSTIKTKARESLKNWITFNADLLEWSESDLKVILKYERMHQKRKTFIDRILKRLGKIQSDKVKAES